MVEEQAAYAAEVDAIFQALSHAIRRSILEAILDKPLSVNEIAAPHRISLNAISKHLKILERARLIRRVRHGTRHMIIANFEAADSAERWLRFYRGRWERQLDALANFLESTPPESKG